MKAVFLEEPGELVVNDVPTPACEAGMVRVRIEAVGVCEDDLSAFLGNTEYQRYPIVPGRDATGVVVETNDEPAASDGNGGDGGSCDWNQDNGNSGDGDEGNSGDGHILSFAAARSGKLEVGDRVVLLPKRIRTEADCLQCDERSRYDHMSQLGFNVDGALREFAVVPREQCVVLPGEISSREGIFLQSVCRAVSAIKTGGVEEFDTVVIIGAGDVGIIAAQAAVHEGARPIIVDPSEPRLQLARSLGIPHTVNPFACFAAEEVEWITSGDMADVVVDTTGDANALGGCFQFAGQGGKVILTRTPRVQAKADLRYIIERELSVHTSRTNICDTGTALNMLVHGQIRVDSLVSTTLPLEAAPFIIPSIAENPDHYLRVVLEAGNGSIYSDSKS